jgi:hypothetical protein
MRVAARAPHVTRSSLRAASWRVVLVGAAALAVVHRRRWRSKRCVSPMDAAPAAAPVTTLAQVLSDVARRGSIDSSDEWLSTVAQYRDDEGLSSSASFLSGGRFVAPEVLVGQPVISVALSRASLHGPVVCEGVLDGVDGLSQQASYCSPTARRVTSRLCREEEQGECGARRCSRRLSLPPSRVTSHAEPHRSTDRAWGRGPVWSQREGVLNHLKGHQGLQ